MYGCVYVNRVYGIKHYIQFSLICGIAEYLSAEAFFFKFYFSAPYQKLCWTSLIFPHIEQLRWNGLECHKKKKDVKINKRNQSHDMSILGRSNEKCVLGFLVWLHFMAEEVTYIIVACWCRPLGAGRRCRLNCLWNVVLMVIRRVKIIYGMLSYVGKF